MIEKMQEMFNKDLEGIKKSQSTFFIVQLSHPYVTTGNTIALTRWTFVNKVMSLAF